MRPGTAADDRQRDALVRGHPRASFFHLSGWRRVVERVYGHEPRELLAWRGDELVGVLPLFLCRAPFGRKKLVSSPYAVYGGPVGESTEVEMALLDEARRVATALNVGHLEVRFADGPHDGFLPSKLYCTFMRELPEDPDDVLSLMPKKARAEARKGRRKHGLEMTEGEWYVDDLYRLFLRNKHALGSPGLPVRHFHAIQDEFGEQAFLHLVRRGRQPLGAVMSFGFGDTLIAYYAGSEPGSDRAYSMSNFMYMALQEWAVRKGFKRFDFCRSRVDSGAFRFKIHQGFEPVPLHYGFFLVRSREIPSFTPSNPKTRVLRETWSRLPFWLAARATDRIAAYLP